MRIRNVPTTKIHVPDVRMTSALSDEDFRSLMASIDERGIREPLKVIENGGRLILADGWNRLQAARQLGMEKVPVVVEKGEESDVFLDNVIASVLRGKTKPSEMIPVVAALRDEYGMTLEMIEAAIGRSAGYISQLLRVADAGEDLRAMVDRGELDVTRAYHVAKISDPASQAYVADQVLRLRMDRQRTKEFVALVLSEQSKPLQEQVPVTEISLPPSTCQVCGRELEPADVVCPILDRSCFALLEAVVAQQADAARPQ